MSTVYAFITDFSSQWKDSQKTGKVHHVLILLDPWDVPEDTNTSLRLVFFHRPKLPNGKIDIVIL